MNSSLKHLGRVYPKGARVDSSNYDPMLGWLCGCQIVALNYQFCTTSVWHSQGFFQHNGRSGYILKPDIQRPAVGGSTSRIPKRLRITICSGHYLGVSVSDDNVRKELFPYVVLIYSGKVHQKQFPDTLESRFETSTESGPNPVWKDEGFSLEVCPSLPSLICFEVWNKSSILKRHNDFIGQYCINLSDLRAGYRVVPLTDEHGQFQQYSHLFVRVEMDP